MTPHLFYIGQEVVSLADTSRLQRYDNNNTNVPPLKMDEIYKIVSYSYRNSKFYKPGAWYVELKQFPGEWWSQDLFVPAGDISELIVFLKEGESIKKVGTS